MSEVPAVEEIAERYNAAAARAQRLASFMCDIALQKAEVIELELTGETIRQAKRAAIIVGMEFAANSFLGCEALLKSITWELRMWIALKEQRPHDAWLALVEAREHACLGLRTPVASPGVGGYADRLETLERAIVSIPSVRQRRPDAFGRQVLHLPAAFSSLSARGGPNLLWAGLRGG